MYPLVIINCAHNACVHWYMGYIDDYLRLYFILQIYYFDKHVKNGNILLIELLNWWPWSNSPKSDSYHNLNYDCFLSEICTEVYHCCWDIPEDDSLKTEQSFVITVTSIWKVNRTQANSTRAMKTSSLYQSGRRTF